MNIRKILKRSHPKVTEAYDQMESGKMDRREFIRYAALLGVTAARRHSNDQGATGS